MSSSELGSPPLALRPPKKHTVTVGSVPFEVDLCYTPTKLIGRGAYGLVCAARAHPSVLLPPEEGDEDEDSDEVAIKKISAIFGEGANLIEAKRTLREICLLRHMRHENVLSIRDVLLPACPNSFADVYIVVEKMDSDMHRIIQSTQPLSADHVRFFVYQLLRGLKYIHSAGIIHRDLKPGNLLLNANCDLKISDFGLARTVEPAAEAQLTQYVVTRWYRAPELLLLATNYSAAVDIWSAGCIFAELLRRTPLFKGSSQLHQLQLILTRLGPPTADERAEVHPQLASALDTAMSLGANGSNKQKGAKAEPLPAEPLKALVPTASADALDLLNLLLKFDPRKRTTAEGALAHPYLADLHEEAAEPNAPEVYSLDAVENEASLDWPQLRGMYNQIAAENLAVRQARSQNYRCEHGLPDGEGEEEGEGEEDAAVSAGGQPGGGTALGKRVRS